MAGEKNFENRVKKWLRSIGVYSLGTPKDKITVTPIGYYEKRWGGGYSKKGLPDMHIVINGINIDVELKAIGGRPSELQKHNIAQINNARSIGIILYPGGFKNFKNIVKEVCECNIHIQDLIRLVYANSNIECNILTR